MVWVAGTYSARFASRKSLNENGISIPFVAIADSAGAIIESFGGGITDGDAIDTNSEGSLILGTTDVSGTARAVIVDDDGHLQVDILSGGGGGAAENAEDSAHTTGDVGNFVLGVRRDADTTPVSADGDYHALIFDDAGNLKVNVKTALPAGTNNIGDVDVASTPVSDAVHPTAATEDATALSTTNWTEMLDFSSTDALEVTVINWCDKVLEVSFDATDASTTGAIEAYLAPFHARTFSLKPLERREGTNLCVRPTATPTLGDVYADAIQ